MFQASLRQAIAPLFEIVFAGTFRARQSMLINALLERELLARGDQNDISNLQTLCCTCNPQKKHKLDPRFRRYLDN